MVLATLFGKRYEKGRVGVVDLDVTLSENHTFNSRATNFPVETGGDVTDHIINDPDILTLSGIVSDTPLNIFSFFTRSIDAFNRLVDLHERRVPVTVVTGLKVYQNMVMTTLDVPRTITTGQSLTFNITLQNIRFDSTAQLIRNTSTIFGGIQSNIPRDQVNPNTNYPIIQYDPADSLKDQSSNGIDTGIQQLIPPPLSIAPRIAQSRNLILGLA